MIQTIQRIRHILRVPRDAFLTVCIHQVDQWSLSGGKDSARSVYGQLDLRVVALA